MAQDAGKSAGQRGAAEAAISPARQPEPSSAGPIDVDLEEDADDEADELGALDHLLADPDSSWDVDAQARTLQQAAETTRLSGDSSPVSGPVSTGAPPPTRSKGPPPLPRKGGSRMPVPPAARSPSPGPVAPVGSPVAATAQPPMRVVTDLLAPDGLIDLLQSRVASLESQGDKVGLARVHVELALASETILGDDGRARAHAEAALRASPGFAAAHGFLRRAKHARSALGALLEHLEQELVAAASEDHRVELLVEKARFLEAMGGRGRDVRAAWEQALAHSPQNPAALKGLEAELVVRALASGAPGDWEALATHLGRMADAYASEPALAAWLHVERARILERRLERADAARSALDRALELDPSLGPVRDSLVRHVSTYGDWAALVRLLDEEAQLETSGARAARLELDAAMTATFRLGEPARACALLERAAARAPTAPGVDRRVLDELVRLNEESGRWADAARARRARLRFVLDPQVMAYELRALASAAERQGDVETAVADVARALVLDATDPSTVETLDRLLAVAGKNDQRIATWLQESARTEDGPRRAKALVRAAQICEETGRREDAVRHLRSAWVAAPGDPEVLDALSRLLAPATREALDPNARSLVELYADAAELARDAGRKIAYLEKVALLWEEVLGDPARAARAYEQVLAIDPDRRGAILGLSRVSSRAGDTRTLARALLDEARIATDRTSALGLRTRAATALAKADPARATALVREVLENDGAHAAARALETRLYEEAGRWELVARSLRARIDAAPSPAEKVALWLSLAQVQHARLRAPLDALSSLERARSLDPSHPAAREETVRMLEDHGDARTLRDAIERLAATAGSPEERARELARAAEIDELRLGDDAAAARNYQRAFTENPDDDAVAERLARTIARRAKTRSGGEPAELATLLGKRVERAGSPAAVRAASFALAWALVESGQEPMRAATLLEAVLAEQNDHVPALRTLEWLRRRAAVDVGSLARLLSRQAEAFRDPLARLGALWNLALLEEWILPGSDPGPTYRAILEIAPADPSALDATLRRDRADARRGDPRARANVVAALRALIPFAPNEDMRLSQKLRLALMLESVAAEAVDRGANPPLLREALDLYADALGQDELSVTAATGLARLAGQLGDGAHALAAAESLAKIADDARTRARCFLDAAEILLGPDETPRLGDRADRRGRAVALLERALEADADSIPAAGRLSTVLLEDHKAERLVSAFRGAIGRARSPDAIVMFGSEIARVARTELQDLPVAIDAMRRVRAAAPQHVPSLLTLAELCIAQRVWPEAVDALEAVVATSRDPSPKLTALFALASIYEKVLDKRADVDRVLRTALAIDPTNARALRALVRRMTSESVDPDDASAGAKRAEIARLLGRLADVETDSDQKTALLLELSEVRQASGDAAGTERALVDAVLASPLNTRPFARLGALFRGPDRTDTEGHMRALGALVARGDAAGRVDARWLVALGQIEVEAPARLGEGIAHLRRAVELDPTLFSTRFTLANAYVRNKSPEEASRTLLAMLAPNPHPLLGLPEPRAALSLLEETLTAERRTEEAVVASELRCIGGYVDDRRRVWLQSRRLPAPDERALVLDRRALVTSVLPSAGRHVLLEVAAAIAGVEAKILRADLNEVGVTSRDRIPARSGHPVRALLDRVARQLGAGELELAVSSKARRVRVVAQDVPWILVPSWFAEKSEPLQLASLARACARVAYGVPWLDELAAPLVEALLIAAARQVVPRYREGHADAKAVARYEPGLTRSLARRQRKLLEELSPHLSASTPAAPPITDFLDALVKGEVRAAFLVTGDLLAVYEEMALRDDVVRQALESPGPRSLAALLNHPVAGDIARFALTPEATGQRRRLGSIWGRTAS